jgi:hypothetical protein
MVRKRFLFFLVLVSTLILPVFVSAMVLWDQPLSIVNTYPYYSNMFVPSNDSDTFLADDFVNAQTWEISTIFVPGSFWTRFGNQSSLGNATALNWAIYADDNGKPDGDPSGNGNAPHWSLRLLPPFSDYDYQATITRGSYTYKSDATLNLTTPLSLAAGHYWLIFYPELEYYTYGGYGRQPADTLNNAVSQFIEPGGGDQGFPTEWTSVLNVPWTELPNPKPALTQQDFAFRIEGTIQDANIDIDPMALSFGRGRIGVTSDPQTVTIKNTAVAADLTLSSIVIGGTSAAMYAAAPGSTNGCTLTGDTLAAGEECTVSVTFTPSDAGTRVAYLQINSNSTNANLIRVNLIGIGAEATASVVEGTIGTEITFTAAPSSNFGTKKGKVVIQDALVKSNLKIAKTDWSVSQIKGIVTKPLAAGRYNVQIMVQPYKTATPIDIAGGFTYKVPEVVDFDENNGSQGETRTVNGKFFGSKKPIVYFWYYDKNNNPKKKNCPVTSITWNAQTGASSAAFKVPRLDPGSYRLHVETKKVGTSVQPINFTIN